MVGLETGEDWEQWWEPPMCRGGVRFTQFTLLHFLGNCSQHGLCMGINGTSNKCMLNVLQVPSEELFFAKDLLRLPDTLFFPNTNQVRADPKDKNQTECHGAIRRDQGNQ